MAKKFVSWTLKERIYVAFAFITALLAAVGVLHLGSVVIGPRYDESISPLIAIIVFCAVLAFMIKAVDAIRKERAAKKHT